MVFNKLNIGQSTRIFANKKNALPLKGLADISMKIKVKENGQYGFKLSNDLGEYIRFYFDKATGKLFFDRTKSGDVSFSNDFPSIHEKLRTSDAENLSIRALVDVSSIEIFIDDGKDVFTEIFFPNKIYPTLEIMDTEKSNSLLSGAIEAIKGVW